MPSPGTGRATANAVGVAACAGRGRGVPFGDAHERRPTSRDGSPFVTVREDAARTMAFLEASDDIALLHQVIAEIAPRAKRMVGQILAKGTEDAIPPPADLRPARVPATKEEALRTVKAVNDFALLQVIARTAGRRVEAIEIAASADFAEGTRVRVPEKPRHPRTGPILEGTVEETGTQLQVLLDNGETWNGPPSLARLASAPE